MPQGVTRFLNFINSHVGELSRLIESNEIDKRLIDGGFATRDELLPSVKFVRQRIRFLLFQVSTGCCPNKNSFERSLKRFFANKSWRSGRSAIERYASLRVNCLSPKDEFSNRLEQALDLSKNVLDQAKRDLGNSLSIQDSEADIVRKRGEVTL